MYIWRGKNRRDKRNLLLGGELFWGAEKGAKNFEHEDHVLRLEREEAHVKYYGRKIKALMIQYLSTPNGMVEVELLVNELEKNQLFANMLTLSDNEDQNEELRANVFNIFQEFCLPETTYIDKDGLIKLFSDLQLTMSKRKFDTYATKLNLIKKGAAVDFDGFFDTLMEDLMKKDSYFFSKSDEKKEAEKESSLHFKMQRRLQQNAAKIILIDHAVHQVEEEALAEYRIAHPSEFTCDQCNRAFVDSHALRTHSRDVALHRDLARRKVTMEDRFTCVGVIFQGNQGRHLRANRLFHSGELGSLRARIDAAVEDPFRPNIADEGGRRYAQQMAGSMVTGFDAKAGIRPNYKRYGLMRQHHAPVRHQANVNSLFQVQQPQLQEVIQYLQRCKDDFIDTVSTCDNPINVKANAPKVDFEQLTDRDNDWGLTTKKDEGSTGGADSHTEPVNSHGMCAIVRFQWNTFADNQVYIIGEFTGWKREEMVCSSKTNKFTIYKQLSPGRYRYRFVIDGVEKVDEVASQVSDPRGPGGMTNEILVTNTPLYHTPHHRSLGRTGVASPLQEATRQHALDKIGLHVPAEVSGKSSSPGIGTRRQAATLPALAAVSFSQDSERSEQSGAVSFAEDAGTEDDQRSVGEIVHISRSDKEGLIRHLKHIQLRNLSLFDDGAWALASYINRNGFIQIIDLSYNNISDDGIQGFSGCLQLLEALHTIKLNGNGFAVDGCRYLADNLAQSTTLTCLELSSNRLGDDGVEVLCKFMKHNEYLQHIYIDSCLVGDDGIECIQEMLLFNRRLKSLSVMGNRFTVKSVPRLAHALQFNAVLETLVLSNNPIGPEAVNSIGSCLLVNDSLKILGLANVDLLAHHSTFGLHGICTGIKANKTLTSLDLKNNRLVDRDAIEIAHVLMVNTVLTELNLTGNTITQMWFTDYTYIPTHILPEMPSIETLMHRNRIHARRANTYDAGKSLYLDDVPKGKWTFRRQWKREVQSVTEKAVIERTYAHEQSRIDAENAYILANLPDIMITFREYLEQEPCKAYTKLLSKAIQQYIFDLGNFDPARYNRFNHAIADIPVIKGKNNVRNASIKLKRSASASSLNSSRGDSPGRPISPARSLLPRRVEPVDFNMEHFLNAHISIIHAVFSQLNGGAANSLIISPLLLQQAFHTLALPLPLNEVQKAVDATLVQVLNATGLHKFSDFILGNAQRLCRENKIHRMRILADLLFNPPGAEARSIVYDHLHHVTYCELRDKYRSIPENAPLFVCPECHKRFIKQKHMDKHVSKGRNSSEHRRHRMKEVIHHSQVLFLQDVKHTLTDVFFPAYYELKPAHLLPKNYYPQVFDKIGKEGRPFGVVEANRTVRVLDVFGEYLHVNLHGELGWIRYRSGKQFFLQPACANQEGFDWDKLHIQEVPSYYRVNDLLPKETELKVRYQPLPEGEVVGYLRRDQVIECLAVIGDWLQVRFEKADAAWVRWRITAPAGAGKGGASSAADGAAAVAATKRVSFNPAQTLRSLSLSGPLSNFLDTGSFAGGSTHTTLSVATQSIAGDTVGTLSPAGSPSPSKHGRKGAHTPGETWDADSMFKDDLITYEINGIKTKVHLRKNPTYSREKIEFFNRMRYGSSADGTSTNTLLMLPQCFVAYITPKTLQGQVAQHPPSPLTLPQKEIFDHIMSLSMEELMFNAGDVAQRDRNDMFLNAPSSPASPKRRHRKKKGGTGQSSLDESGFSPMGRESLGEFTLGSDEEGGAGSKFGVSFKDDVYSVKVDEDEAGQAGGGGLHLDTLQGYDFTKPKRRNAATLVALS